MADGDLACGQDAAVGAAHLRIVRYLWCAGESHSKTREKRGGRERERRNKRNKRNKRNRGNERNEKK